MTAARKPIPVAVVRPSIKGWGIVTKLLTGLIIFAVNAWVVMVAADSLTSWHPSYWDAMLALVAVRALQVPPSWTSWTHEAKS